MWAWILSGLWLAVGTIVALFITGAAMLALAMDDEGRPKSRLRVKLEASIFALIALTIGTVPILFLLLSD